MRGAVMCGPLKPSGRGSQSSKKAGCLVTTAPRPAIRVERKLRDTQGLSRSVRHEGPSA
jgi:hypothetical protein